MVATTPQFLNNAAENKFKLNFSNIPNFIKYSDIDVLYTRFVREITLPEFTLDVIQQRVRGSIQIQPISQKNDDMGELIVTFGLDEKFLNYYNFQLYMKKLRYADEDMGETYLYRNTIHSIELIRLDNESREIKTVKFTECLPVNLGSLNMKMGSSELPEFTVQFKYQEMIIDDPST